MGLWRNSTPFFGAATNIDNFRAPLKSVPSPSLHNLSCACFLLDHNGTIREFTNWSEVNQLIGSRDFLTEEEITPLPMLVRVDPCVCVFLTRII